jgi:DNA-binding NtrC family response regulator
MMAIILVVEDDDQVRVLTESFLRDQGHRTVTASTPQQAMAVLGVTKGADVLFTDIGLAGDPHAGLALAKQAMEHKPELKVLFTTGQAITDGMRAMMVEGSAVLEKPYTVEQLQSALVVHFRIRPSGA